MTLDRSSESWLIRRACLSRNIKPISPTSKHIWCIIQILTKACHLCIVKAFLSVKILIYIYFNQNILICTISMSDLFYPTLESKGEGKDQEPIQSSTTPDPESDKSTRKHHIQESQEVSPFPTGDHKAARSSLHSSSQSSIWLACCSSASFHLLLVCN